MRRCVDCGAPCRNTCANGNHGYCANCRDASGSRTCGKCRTAAKAAKQLARSKQQAARQAQATANTPLYVPPPALAPFAQPAPGSGHVPPVHPVVARAATKAHLAAQRSPIYLMNEATFQAWQEKTLDALQDAQARGSTYLARRQVRGTRTSTDITLERDQLLFEDLIQAVKELDILREWAEDTQTQQQQTSSNTGILLPYDDGKLTP